MIAGDKNSRFNEAKCLHCQNSFIYRDSPGDYGLFGGNRESLYMKCPVCGESASVAPDEDKAIPFILRDKQ